MELQRLLAVFGKKRWSRFLSKFLCISVILLSYSVSAQHVHPLQTMVLRAREISPIMFYGRNGRVHMQYRPVIPKVLYIVGVLGELMRGVGSSVSEVVHRAVATYPGHGHGHTYQEPYHSPYYSHPYYYNHPKRRSQGQIPQMQFAPSLTRPRFAKPPPRGPRPPSPPGQNIMEIVSKAIAGAR